MLLSVTIKNYKSIHSLTLSLRYAEGKAPNGYKEMEQLPFLEEGSIRGVPCLAMYGSNASGKSNIIQAIQSLIEVVRSGYEPELIIPNALQSEEDRSSIEIEFTTNLGLFYYAITVDRIKIIDEQLTKDGKLIFSRPLRSTDLEQLATLLYPAERIVKIVAEQGGNRIPLLQVFGRYYVGVSNDIAAAYSFITDNIKVYPHAPSSEDGEHLPLEFITPMLRKFDFDVVRMEMKKDRRIILYRLDDERNEVGFDLQEESSGLQRTVVLLGIMLRVLRLGTILIIDDLNQSLHPLLLAAFVSLFKDRRYNTSNAQLIFTSHNTDLLDQDILRVSEIGIVNRSRHQGTRVKRLADFKGIRNVTNFRKQYLYGSFDGIPFPYI